jgi:integrase/recombinase XerD
MVYFKLLLNDKRPKTDNIYPIVVRVTYNRNNTTFNTGIRIEKNHWDETNHKVKHTNSNAQGLNKTISDFYAKVQKAALRLADDGIFSFDKLHIVCSKQSSKSNA